MKSKGELYSSPHTTVRQRMRSIVSVKKKTQTSRTVLLSLILLTAQPIIAQTATDPVKIMAVGDSITQGVNGADSYRPEFSELLTLTGCDHQMVGSQGVAPHWHEGYSGHSAEHMLVGLDDNPGIDAMMATYAPNVVLLHIGSNDMRRAQSITETAQEIDSILTKIKDASLNSGIDTTILVANIIPWWGTSSTNSNIEADVESMGDAIETLISNRGDPNIVLVDVRDGFTRDMMQSDLIHPKTAGESFIADAFFDAYGLFYSCAQSPDLTAPRTFITTPSENQAIDGIASYGGYATDTGGSGFERVRVAIRDTDTQLWYSFSDHTFGPISNNGIDNLVPDPLTVTDSYAEWNTADIPLPTGNYQFFALAEDVNGNDAYHGLQLSVWPVSTTFTVTNNITPDTNPPSGSVTSPANNASIQPDASVAINGESSDDLSGVNRVFVRVQRRDVSPKSYWNGTTWQSNNLSGTFRSATVNSDGNWTLTGVDLSQPGSYRITLKIRDFAGNTSTTQNPYSDFTVEQTDTTPPGGSVTSPANSASIQPAASVAINGESSDDLSGVNRVFVRVQRRDVSPKSYWNGTTWQSTNLSGTFRSATVDSDGNWNLTGVDLSQPGSYRITLKIRDFAGNTSTTQNPYSDFTVQ